MTSIPSNPKTIITNRTLGLIMLCVAVVIVFAMLRHPEGVTSSKTQLSLLRWVHGTLIFLIIFNAYAVGRFMTQTEDLRAGARLGQVFYNVGLGGFIGAALISGFIQTGGSEIYADQASNQGIYRALNQYAAIGNQALAKLGIAAYGAAGIFWLFPMFKQGGFTRFAGGFGLTIGLVLLATLLAGNYLSVQTMTALTVLIVVWHGSFAICFLKNEPRKTP